MTTETTEQTTLVVEHYVELEQSPEIHQQSEGSQIQRIVIRGEFILYKEELKEFVKSLLELGLKNHTKDIPSTVFKFQRLTGTLIHEEIK